jgi:hypothetical protein
MQADRGGVAIISRRKMGILISRLDDWLLDDSL